MTFIARALRAIREFFMTMLCAVGFRRNAVTALVAGAYSDGTFRFGYKRGDNGLGATPSVTPGKLWGRDINIIRSYNGGTSLEIYLAGTAGGKSFFNSLLINSTRLYTKDATFSTAGSESIWTWDSVSGVGMTNGNSYTLRFS